MESLPLALLLLGGFVASMATGALQHRYYMRSVNRLAGREHRAGVTLISGRATGRLRGAVVLLLVRGSDEVVERALVMQGASVFARFREHPSLNGPLTSAATRASSAAVVRAVEDARDRYHQMISGGVAEAPRRHAARRPARQGAHSTG